MVASGKGRDGLAVQVTTSKAEEMGTTDAETRGGLGGVEDTGIEIVEGAMDEVLGQAVAELALFFMGSFKRPDSPLGEAFRRSPLRSDLLHASPRGLSDVRVSFCSNRQSPFAPTPTMGNGARGLPGHQA